MEISSVLAQGTNYSVSKTQTLKTESSDKVSESKECSEAEKLKAFKQEFLKKVEALPYKKGASVSVQITDGAFKRMMKEPKFKEEMMQTLNEDARTSHYEPVGTVLTKIDQNGYSGYSYCKENEGAFAAHSSNKDSFYSKKAEKKYSEAESNKKELERMYQKKIQDKEYYENLTEKKLQYQEAYVSKQYAKNINSIYSDI
ncbi:hypothetical protein psyc5s11_07760 [Clostridium gelidum]|uniref:Uncharacterized protein n=1 Tax=Clostridium gelidum TaxID=704125 RepID=A0ABM7T1G4_9CLOT|nr:hypothetical protein [Clostridium gelidum]BCZ44709.1 hypothetical protein psyc5s11_07760 [Clostridium gelidum]